MSLICITGHQGTGKSTLLNKVKELGYTAIGLDEEKLAGYFDVERGTESLNIPTGLDRNLSWRKNNVWKVDVNKIRQLELPSDEPVFIFGYAVNIEDVWDVCDVIIVLQLDKEVTAQRLINRTNNSFGKHPGEIELAIKNSHTIDAKAKKYIEHPVHYINATIDTDRLAAEIIKISS